MFHFKSLGLQPGCEFDAKVVNQTNKEREAGKGNTN